MSLSALVATVIGCCLTAWFSAAGVAKRCMQREHRDMRVRLVRAETVLVIVAERLGIDFEPFPIDGPADE